MDMYIELLFKLVCVGDCVSLSSFNAREVFVHDPNLTAYRTTTTDTHSDMLTDETKLEKGWMTKEQVGDLNKIVPGVQNYQKKIDALVVGLPTRPHRKAIVPIIACARHLLVRKAGIQAGRHTGRQAGRQAGRQTGNSFAHSPNRPAWLRLARRSFTTCTITTRSRCGTRSGAGSTERRPDATIHY